MDGAFIIHDFFILFPNPVSIVLSVRRYEPIMRSYLASCPAFRGSEKVTGEILKSLARILPRYEHHDGEDRLFQHYLTGILYHKAMREVSRALPAAERPGADAEVELAWRNALCELALFETLHDRGLAVRSRELFRRVALGKENARDVGFDFALAEGDAKREVEFIHSRYRRLAAALAKIDGAKLSAGEADGFITNHAPIEAPTLFSPGETFGAWKIAAFLGRGETCEIYRAVHISLAMQAAVKVLVSVDEADKARFVETVRFLYDNKAPFLPQCLGSGEKNGRQYAVMEFMEPVELPSRDSEAAKFLVDAARGVGYLHSKGVAGLDLEASNIMKRSDDSRALASISIRRGRKEDAGRRDARYGDIRALGALAKECFGGFASGAWVKIIRRAEVSCDSFGYRSTEEFARAIVVRHRPRYIAIALILVLAAAFAGAWFAGFRPF